MTNTAPVFGHRLRTLLGLLKEASAGLNVALTLSPKHHDDLGPQVLLLQPRWPLRLYSVFQTCVAASRAKSLR